MVRRKNQDPNRQGGDKFLKIAALSLHQCEQPRDILRTPLLEISSIHSPTANQFQGHLHAGQRYFTIEPYCEVLSEKGLRLRLLRFRRLLFFRLWIGRSFHVSELL